MSDDLNSLLTRLAEQTELFTALNKDLTTAKEALVEIQEKLAGYGMRIELDMIATPKPEFQPAVEGFEPSEVIAAPVTPDSPPADTRSASEIITQAHEEVKENSGDFQTRVASDYEKAIRVGMAGAERAALGNQVNPFNPFGG
jgi:hypothetical protein